MLVVGRVVEGIVEVVIFAGFKHKKTVFGVLPNTVRALLMLQLSSQKSFLPEIGIVPNANS